MFLASADLRNVSHARQRLILCSNKEDDPVLDLEEDYVSSDHIRGLSVTPGGRLLVAHSVTPLPLSLPPPPPAPLSLQVQCSPIQHSGLHKLTVMMSL